jgi:hypothetical protein
MWLEFEDILSIETNFICFLAKACCFLLPEITDVIALYRAKSI